MEKDKSVEKILEMYFEGSKKISFQNLTDENIDFLDSVSETINMINEIRINLPVKKLKEKNEFLYFVHYFENYMCNLQRHLFFATMNFLQKQAHQGFFNVRMIVESIEYLLTILIKPEEYSKLIKNKNTNEENFQKYLEGLKNQTMKNEKDTIFTTFANKMLKIKKFSSTNYLHVNYYSITESDHNFVSDKNVNPNLRKYISEISDCLKGEWLEIIKKNFSEILKILEK